MGFLDSTGLSRFFSNLERMMDEKVDVSQGSINEGCILVVGSDGNLELVDLPVQIGVPYESDRMARVRINSSNASNSVYDISLEDEDVGFEPDCTYAGSIHLYMPGAEYISNLDFCMYQETQAGTDSLLFSNTIMIGSTVYRFISFVDLAQEETRMVIYSGDTIVRPDALLGTGGISRFDLIIRKVQGEPL